MARSGPVMWRLMRILIPLVSGVLASGTALAEDYPHVAIVVGTHHYSPHRTLPHFAKELDRLGFRTTLVMGVGDPETKTENVLPGIKVLDDADAVVLYARFLNLPEAEWQPVERYIKSGKPIVGLRTANHAFKFQADDPRFEWNSNFGRRVFGTPYIAHQQTKTNIRVVDKHKAHPILSGIEKTNWESAAKLYLTRLQPGCVPLIVGEGEGKSRLLEKDFGTIQINESETDVVAWTWKNEWGAKVFSTTLGHASDFGEASFTRMLVNSVCWATGRPQLPASEKIATWSVEMEVPSKYEARK